MSEVHTFRCDICGTLKQDTNHWWKGLLSKGAIGIYIHDYEIGDSVVNLCGFECVSKWVGQQMQKIVGGQ